MGTPNDLKSKIHGDIILNIKVEDPDDGDIKLIQGLSTVTGVDVVDNQYTISLRSKKDINDIINVFEGDILSINTKEPTLEMYLLILLNRDDNGLKFTTISKWEFLKHSKSRKIFNYILSSDFCIIFDDIRLQCICNQY